MDKHAQQAFEIWNSKSQADSGRYFSLFEKHLPSDMSGKDVLLYDIGNVGCICEIASRMQSARLWLHDNDLVVAAVKSLFPEVAIQKVEGFDDMKFDCIIMNPPYQRDLHLRILKEAMNHVDMKNGGKVVCLHPSKWIKRFDYWKNRWNMFPVESIDEISSREATDIFNGAYIGSSIITTVLSKNGTIDYKKFSRFIPWVKEKIIDKAPFLLSDPKCKYRTRKPDNQFQLNLPIVHGNINCYDMTEITSKIYERALKVAFGKRKQDINSLCFSSENERRNFYDSTFTTFMKFLIITCRDGQTAGSCYYALPVMDDYSQPWTNERFKKFFNLSDEEWKYIEDTMAKYTKATA